MDDTSSASFVLFDRDSYQVIGKTAAELRENVIQVIGSITSITYIYLINKNEYAKQT